MAELLKAACTPCPVGTVTVRRCDDSGDHDSFGAPIPSADENEWELLGPIGYEYTNQEHNRDDRHRVLQHVRFWIIPQDGDTIRPRDQIIFCGECFDVLDVKPRPVSCCCGRRLHHYEIEACSDNG